jgi:hypothetical protein
MIPVRNKADGRVHYSELKHIALCPAHYRRACEYPKEPTRAMTVGAVTDSLLFSNQSVAVYPGKVRNGKEWDAFRESNEGHILCLAGEFSEANERAMAVATDPVAVRALYGCETQGVLHWDMFGLPFASGIEGVRGGFDAYSAKAMINVCSFADEYGPYTADLKATVAGTPETLMRHAIRQLWHVQGALFGEAMRALGKPWQTHRLICVDPIGVVTVLRFTDAAIFAGRKILSLWCDQLRACESSGSYPGYAQDEIECDVSEYLELTGLEESE